VLNTFSYYWFNPLAVSNVGGDDDWSVCEAVSCTLSPDWSNIKEFNSLQLQGLQIGPCVELFYVLALLVYLPSCFVPGND
jgi:hypothetical protein